MGTVLKRRGRDGKLLRNYSISWFDHTGKRVTKSAGTSDKRAAERILRERETRVAEILNGTIDLHAEKVQAEARRGVGATKTAYLDQFEVRSKRRGSGQRSKTTIRDERGNLRLFFDEDRASGLNALADLASPRFPRTVDAVAKGWVDAGLSGSTVNKRVGSLRRFLAWCVDEGLLRENPLGNWKPFAFGAKRRRRPLTDEEVGKLLAVAEEKGRKLWYLMAVRTGLRRSEMRRLKWRDVDLEARAIRLPASQTKSRREAALPILGELLDALMISRPSDALPSAHVFPTIPSNLTRQRDFKLAGIAPEDEEGRHADLHSLRSTLATNLARAGVSPQLHQEFMRHGDYRTTRQYYVHLRVEDLAEAARKLEPGHSSSSAQTA